MILYKYEGNFENGEMTGEGLMIYENGDWYKGNFLKGTYNGIGEMHFH